MNNVIELTGQLREVRKYNDWFYSRVILPSGSPYEAPSVVEVRSKKRIGSAGDEVTLEAKLGGYIKRFSYVDKETGEPQNRSTCTMYLDLVES